MNKNLPTTEVDKNYPPEQSASPYNAYYLRGCDVVERSPAYASCLYKIRELAAGRPVASAAECNAAIAGGRCQAKEMQQQEALKGVALFFFPSLAHQNRTITNLTPESELPRRTVGDTRKAAFISGHYGAANFKGRYQEYVPPMSKKTGVPAVPTVPPLKTRIGMDDIAPIGGGSYADALNAAMKDMTTAPAIPPVTLPPVVVVPLVAHVSAVGRPMMALNESPLQYARRIAATMNQQRENV